MPQIETTSVPWPETQGTSGQGAEAPEGPAAGDTASGDIAALDATTPDTPSLAAPAFPVITIETRPETPVQAPSDADAPRLPQITRLPQGGNAVIDAAPEAVEEASVEPETTEAQPDGELPAIEAFAAPFDLQEDRPLMAVVLIDDPETSLDLEALTGFTFPVAFAVDPLHPEATDRAAAYREAGYEVVMLGSMVIDGAT
ncbi:MAG: hypothetical protein AAFZ09_18900, partial [Pseudomonadota bacterium]